MKCLVFGVTGQVAREFSGLRAPGVSIRALSRAEANLADPEACARAVAQADADIVINLAALTDVDRAETEEELALTVNGRAPGAMARAAARTDRPFIHLSTDFVFDGLGHAPLDEDAPTAPINAYGRSKLVGEEETLAAGGRPVILRTTRVFAAHGANFVRKMIAAARNRPELRVVDDQFCGPTSATDIARTIVVIAEAFREGRGEPGVYHYSSLPVVSLYEFTCELFRRAPWAGGPSITPISSADWPTPAIRPQRPILDCSRIADAYGVPQPDWRPALSRVLAELERAEA